MTQVRFFNIRDKGSMHADIARVWNDFNLAARAARSIDDSSAHGKQIDKIVARAEQSHRSAYHAIEGSYRNDGQAMFHVVESAVDTILALTVEMWDLVSPRSRTNA